MASGGQASDAKLAEVVGVGDRFGRGHAASRLVRHPAHANARQHRLAELIDHSSCYSGASAERDLQIAHRQGGGALHIQPRRLRFRERQHVRCGCRNDDSK